MHHNPRRRRQQLLALEIWQNLGLEVEQGERALVDFSNGKPGVSWLCLGCCVCFLILTCVMVARLTI